MQTQTETLTPEALAAAIVAADASALMDDGATLELGGGYWLRVNTEPDDDGELPETMGRLEWGQSQSQRPTGFTGAAEILDRDRGQCLWWEPYRDSSGVYNRSEDRTYVLRFLREGYIGVVLDLHGPATGLGGAYDVRIDRVSVWGVESWEWGDQVGDLLYELAENVKRRSFDP